MNNLVLNYSPIALTFCIDFSTEILPIQRNHEIQMNYFISEEYRNEYSQPPTTHALSAG